MRNKCNKGILRVVLFCIAVILLVMPAMAATTQLHIVKYANDGTTVLNETTTTYQWLEENLPLLGDGTTHYYRSGAYVLQRLCRDLHGIVMQNIKILFLIGTGER